MRATTSTLRRLLPALLLVVAAQAACASNGDEVSEEITPVYRASADAGDQDVRPVLVATSPMSVAQDWAAGLGEQDLPAEAAAVASSLVNPHVARLWREGQGYRAVIAGESADRGGRALILTLTEEQGRWSVTSVETGEASAMWSEP